MRIRIAFSLFALLVVTAPAGRPAPLPAAAEAVVVRVRLEQLAEAGFTPVPLSHAFKNGDRLRLAVQVNRAGHLYLLYRGRSGATERLAEAALLAGESVLVPAEGALRMDDRPGTETVQILFSLVRLDDPILAARPPAAGERPHIRQIRLRELSLDAGGRPGDAGAAFSADLDPAGVALLDLPLQHR